MLQHAFLYDIIGIYFLVGINTAQAQPLTYKIEGNSVTITDCDESFEGDLVIPSSYQGKPVTKIGYGAFYKCSSLTSVTIPGSVTSIGDWAFKDCFGVTSLMIGNGVTSIGDAAFDKCIKLKSLTIPNSVTSIGDSAFAYCTSLKRGNI